MKVDARPSRAITPELFWSVPGNTRHREYTVTDMCYLIEAQTPCSGCTLVGVQSPDKGVIVDFRLPSEADERYRINVPFALSTIDGQVDQGINLLTLMGGEPLTIRGFDEVIRYVATHPRLNGLIYSSSAYYFKPDGTPNRKLDEHEEAGLFTPEFGYFKASVDLKINDVKKLPPVGHPLRGDAFKSLHGLRLAELLVSRGHEVAIHQTLKDYTIDHTLDLYEWSKDRGIRFSMCPMVYGPYVSNGKPEAFYSHHLTADHKSQLKEVVDYIISDTASRFKRGEKRLYVPSSAFTRLIPNYGATNTLSCRVHRNGIRPNGHDIHPNGQERWCIAQNTPEDGLNCSGCFYIGIDRDGDYWNFEHLAELGEKDIRWLNADVWRKDLDYDQTGTNLFFDSQGNSLHTIN